MYISNREKVVFIGETVFVIREKPLLSTMKLSDFLKKADNVAIIRDEANVLAKYLKELTLGEITCKAQLVVLSVHSKEFFFKALSREFKVIQAGGGVVKSSEGLLMINRLGKWDLPKGKLEKGEDIAECSVREVEEECHVKVSLDKHRVTSYHTYTLKGKAILKETYWYNMKAEAGQELVPQKEEGIEEVKWAKSEAVDEAMKNTYGSIAWVLGKLEL